jgi:glutamine amidotransferase
LPEGRKTGHDGWGLRNGSFMYFVHSYFATPDTASDNLAFTEYGSFRYCSAVQRENILGVQFHPERSGEDGLNFYRHWGSWIQSRF